MVRHAVLLEPIKIPAKRRNRSKLKIYELASELLNEYERLCPLLRKIKGKARNYGANALMAIQEVLKGKLPKERLKRYCSMKPSDAVCDYLCWWYNLDTTPASLEKFLATFKKIGFPRVSEIDRWLSGSEGQTIMGQMYYGSRFPRIERLRWQLKRPSNKSFPKKLSF